MTTTARAYFDNAATTRVRDEVLGAYVEYSASAFGNPSSFQHEDGRQAKSVLDWSREIHANIMGVSPDTVIFTSNGTESNNIVINSCYRIAVRSNPHRNVIITSSVEHSSVKKTATQVAGVGQHIMVPVDSMGYVKEDVFAKTLADYKNRIALVSIIFVQSETGTVQQIKRLVKIAKTILGPGIPFHTDATQGFGKYNIRPADMGVDLMTASAHKYHGPRGVGILYAKKGVLDTAVTTMTGGGQEMGFRSGTENVPAIAAAAVALKYMRDNGKNIQERVFAMKEMIVNALIGRIHGSRINGEQAIGGGMFNIISISIPNIYGLNLAKYLDEKGISIGTGSACNRGKPSETLLAMGKSQEEISSAIRISLSDMNTVAECQMLITEILTYCSIMASDRSSSRR